MAALDVKCRDMPNMKGVRITIWLVSPRNPWHPPMFPYREHQRDAGYYAVKAVSDYIWTDDGRIVPQIKANALVNPDLALKSREPSVVSSASQNASGLLWTP